MHGTAWLFSKGFHSRLSKGFCLVCSYRVFVKGGSLPACDYVCPYSHIAALLLVPIVPFLPKKTCRTALLLPVKEYLYLMHIYT
uniref:Uncharacterized protein n=1 Tax=Anguilla anguilla TaxID=7936 RepID=A0A0E9UQH4_ANGAN